MFLPVSAAFWTLIATLARTVEFRPLAEGSVTFPAILA
jgi:hypothetical protein